MLLDHVCFTNETVVLLKCDFYSGRGRRSRTDRFLRVLSQTLSSFSGGLWLFVGSAYVFWKLLGGHWQMGFLGKAVWSSSGVKARGRPATHAQNHYSDEAFRAGNSERPQKRKFAAFFFLFFFLYLFFHLFISLTDKGQMVIQSLLEFQNRPPSFHSTPPPRPPPPSPPPRPSRGQARVPVMEQIHQDTF